MSGMHEFLTSYYGNASAEPEDLQKQAEMELFAKLAAEQNIDLNTLSDEQISTMFEDFQKQASASKVAEEGKKEEKEEGKEEGKEEEAKKELAEKKAASEKVAEADALGRIMAHAYVDELKKIATAEQEKEAGLADKAKSIADKAKGAVGPARDKAKELADKARDVFTAKQFRGGMTGRSAAKTMPEGLARHTMSEQAKKDIRHGAAKTVGAYAGLGAAGGAVGAAASHKKKESSAVDELAAELAVVKAAEAGYDLEDAALKIAALLEEGPAESEKTAGIFDLEPAVEIRSLELLEQLGVPVNWNV